MDDWRLTEGTPVTTLHQKCDEIQAAICGAGRVKRDFFITEHEGSRTKKAGIVVHPEGGEAVER